MREDSKEFVYSLKDMLSKMFTDLELSVDETTKNNDVVCPSLVVEQNNGVSLTIMMDTFYREYLYGEEMDLICETIYELIRRHLALAGPQFADFGRISAKIGKCG